MFISNIYQSFIWFISTYVVVSLFVLKTESKIGTILMHFAHANQGRTEGARGALFPGRRITMGAPTQGGGAEKSNNVTSTSFNTVHLLPKDLRFEHGGAKFVSCPWRHLTSLRP